MTDSHAISALLRKRAEIAGKIEATHRQLNDLVADLDYIDHAIRVMDPECDTSQVRPKPFPPRLGAFRGEMSRLVLGHLRAATEPSTTLEIAYDVMDARGLDRNDQRTVTLIRKRVGACLYKLKRNNVVREVAYTGEYKRWELVR